MCQAGHLGFGTTLTTHPYTVHPHTCAHSTHMLLALTATMPLLGPCSHASSRSTGGLQQVCVGGG